MMLNRLLNMVGLDRRSADYQPLPPQLWAQYIKSGGAVSPQAVMSGLAVAHRCVEIKATLIASVPVKVYQRGEDGGRERVSDTPLARVIDRPNDYMTRFEFFELVSRHLDLYGNFYARIIRDNAGSISALIPLDARGAVIERTASGRLRYKFSTTGEPVILLDSEVLHVKNQSPDGIQGQSPVTTAARALGLAIDEFEAADALASTGYSPWFGVSHPGKLSDKARQNIRESFMGMTGPRSLDGRIPVFEDGTKPERISFSSVEAQLLESRKWSGEDIARIFGLPPGFLGLTNSVSYGSAAQSTLDAYVASINPWAARIESALERCLLSEEGRREFFIEFDLSGLLRADPSARWQQYRIAREVGAMSPNDIRRLENMAPIEGGDEYTRPLNTAPLGFNPQQGNES